VRRLVETKAEEIKDILDRGVVSTNHYLCRLHNLAVSLGWLPWRILPSADWPKIRAKPRRGITFEEHVRIINAEGNQERRSFYQLLWEIGASQTDAAMLTAQNINWNEGVLVYTRLKTGSAACVRIREHPDALLQNLPEPNVVATVGDYQITTEELSSLNPGLATEFANADAEFAARKEALLG
jgi:hypothetical protein